MEITMSRTRFFLKLASITGLVIAVGLSVISTALAQNDPLPSWNNTAPKAAIIRFVKEVTTQGSAGFVPVQERIAVFDNEGTLSVEQPLPPQLAFELDCVQSAVVDHPDWATTPPFNAALERNVKALAQAGEDGLAQIMVASHAGWSTDLYESTLSSWIATTRDARYKRTYTELVYKPMLELLAYLRANDFKTFVVSNSGIDFIRPWTETVYGVPPNQIVGTSIKTKFELEYGNLALIRLPELNFVRDNSGKPVAIHEAIGRQPIAAFGNSDGDLEMLQWTTMGRGPRLGMIVHHTDAEREYAYDRNADFGSLEKVLTVAPANGWTVIDMKNDWKTIFPFEQK